jgi:hypothetical protein
MFTVLSEARRRLMLEVMHEPKTINELTQSLHRNRSAITKDVGLLEKVGLVVSQRLANPGHGIQKVVRSIAPKIEMVSGLASAGLLLRRAVRNQVHNMANKDCPVFPELQGLLRKTSGLGDVLRDCLVSLAGQNSVEPVSSG